MTNKEFIEKIAEMTGLDYEEIADVYKITSEFIAKNICHGSVHVPYIANFKLVKKQKECPSSSITSHLRQLIKHEKCQK